MAASPPDVLTPEEADAVYERGYAEALEAFGDGRRPASVACDIAALLAVAREAAKRERAAIVAGLRGRAARLEVSASGRGGVAADRGIAAVLRDHADWIEGSG